MGFIPDYNPAEAYSRSEVVDELHGFYHHNNADQFSTDKESDYVTAIVILGAAPLMLAVAILLIYFVLLFYRCCKSSCAAKEAFCGPICSRFLLGFLFLAALVFGMGLWGARYDFNMAVDKLAYSMTNDDGSGLVDIFANIEQHGGSLTSQASAYYRESTQIDCPALSSDVNALKAKTLQLKNEADKLPSYYEKASSSLSGLNEKAEKMSKRHVNIGIGVVFALVLFYTFMGVSAAGQGSSRLLDCTSCWGSTVLPLMAVVLGLELGLSIIVADYCAHDTVSCSAAIDYCPAALDGQQVSGPDASSLKVIHRSFEGAGGNTEELVGYYVRCSGTHPLDSVLANVDQYRKQLFENAEALQSSGQCTAASAASLNLIKSDTAALGTTYNTVHALKNSLSCEGINQRYRSVTYDAMCTHSVDGLYKLWVVQAFVCSFLVLSHFFSVFVRPKFLEQKYADEYDDPTAFGDLDPTLANANARV